MFDVQTPETHALMQDPAFAAALRLCGQSPITLPSGLTLLSRRVLGIPLLMLPRAVPPTDLTDQLRAKNLHRCPLILSPESPFAPLGLRLKAAQTLLHLDLTADTATRRARLHPKWRNQLRRAEDSPLRVRQRTLEPDHPLLALEETQSKTIGYRNWPRALTTAFATVAPAQTQLFTATLRGHPVAHMLFLTHGHRATYHIGHTTPEGRAHHAHNLILWLAMTHLARTGHVTVDLGRIDAGTPTLNRFKHRTGARPHQTGGTWLRWSPLAPWRSS
ncbi:GNAT family N-acetyltransferase [Sulfitobacter sp. JB4-11]|uniref:GNAT family N-acetyltransferase n=1 Tax=Sulfitobacter rhodophyticola TaxID=3238304 RepID=UPI003D816E3D